MQPTSPNISSITYQILDLNREGYYQLVVRGLGNAAASAVISSTNESKLINNPVKDENMLHALVAGLWLWNDSLDEAHKIAQKIETETGAFWHAIMHRREGDFANSKYWYARCRNHPVLMALSNQSGIILNDLPADNRLIRLTANGWNTDYMVDMVEQYHARPEEELHKILVVLQQLEWRVLLEYCAALA